jgi:DNA replication protein DnaC
MTLQELDFTAQPGAERPLILRLAQLTWTDEHSNVCFFALRGTGKSHFAITLAIKAHQAGCRARAGDRPAVHRCGAYAMLPA